MMTDRLTLLTSLRSFPCQLCPGQSCCKSTRHCIVIKLAFFTCLRGVCPKLRVSSSLFALAGCGLPVLGQLMVGGEISSHASHLSSQSSEGWYISQPVGLLCAYTHNPHHLFTNTNTASTIVCWQTHILLTDCLIHSFHWYFSPFCYLCNRMCMGTGGCVVVGCNS